MALARAAVSTDSSMQASNMVTVMLVVTVMVTVVAIAAVRA